MCMLVCLNSWCLYVLWFRSAQQADALSSAPQPVQVVFALLCFGCLCNWTSLECCSGAAGVIAVQKYR